MSACVHKGKLKMAAITKEDAGKFTEFYAIIGGNIDMVSFNSYCSMFLEHV